MFVVLLVALGLVGATYAAWSDTVQVTGTVSTGTFEVDITEVSCNAPPLAQVSSSKQNGNATVTVGNAYPGLEFTCTFTVENKGTIPAKWSNPVIKTNKTVNYVSYSVVNTNPSPVPNPLPAGQVVTATVKATFLQNTPQGDSFTYEVIANFEQATT